VGCLKPAALCESNADCPPGFVCDAQVCCWGALHQLDAGIDAGPVGDGGYREITWKPLYPNVMLVIDRSGSMVEPIDESCQCDNPNSQPTCCTLNHLCFSPFDPNSPNDCKWKDLIQVLTNPNSGLLPNYQAKIRFGLTIFPSNANCGSGSVSIEPEENNGAAIAGALNAMGPNGGTPTADTLNQVGADTTLTDPLRSDFVLLITDGEPNCNTAKAAECDACCQNNSLCSGPVNANGTSMFCNAGVDPMTLCSGTPPSCDGTFCLDGDGTVAAVTSLRMKNVLTAVLGLGSEAASPDAYAVLNAAANAGGAPNPAGPPSFYPAGSATQLASFIGAIAAAVPECKFLLGQDVPPKQLVVLLDGSPVAADPQNGYVYDESHLLVTFEGATCRIASDGKTHDIEFQAPE
jgi:hypothetical protein